MRSLTIGLTMGALKFTMRNPAQAHANEVGVHFLWDEQYLYICAEIYDDRIVLLTADSTHLYLEPRKGVAVKESEFWAGKVVNQQAFSSNFHGGRSLKRLRPCGFDAEIFESGFP
jgi:hypothetical protein